MAQRKTLLIIDDDVDLRGALVGELRRLPARMRAVVVLRYWEDRSIEETAAAIINMVTNGKVNQMPAQGEKLSEAQIKVLASYVWGLSNNKQPTATK